MIEFVEDTHKYINSKGVIIPSVSDLVKFKFDTYKGVDEKILKQKAEFGTKVHEAIEDYLQGKKTKGLTLLMKECLEEFKRIKKEAMLTPERLEFMTDYSERYAGRSDMVTKDKIIVDYKTTQKPMEEKWSWNLGYYALAEHTKDKSINTEYGYVVWLPKGGRGKLIKVIYPSKEELLENLKAYEKQKK